MKLNAIRSGTEGPEGVPLVVAHGLFGSAKNWGAVAKRLAAGRAVVAVDLRNHGESGWDGDHSYGAMAGDLLEMIEDIGGRADVLGHSMGGKAAMVLASTRPEAVRRLVVADIAPVAYGHSQIGYVEAMRGLDLEGLTRRGEAERRLAEAVPDRGVRAFLIQSLGFEDGVARWRLNLETLAAQMDEIMGFPDLEPGFGGPVLALRGGASDYVGEAQEGALRALFPQARIETLEGAGHWLHAEAPEPFAAAVARFLDG
jgi:esterase